MASISRHAALVLAMLGAGSAHADVVISTKPTSNMSCSNGVCTPTAKKAVLNVSDLDGMLADGIATIKSTAQNPDIEITTKLSWSNESKLTLDSYHSITFGKPVVVAGAGAMTITTNDGGAGGDFFIPQTGHIEFHDNKSTLIINGDRYWLVSSMQNLIKRTTGRFPNAYVAIAKDIDASGKTYSTAPIATYDGSIEGLGNAISNFSIDDPSDGIYTGLIGWSGEGVQNIQLRDIGLVNVSITSTSSTVGSLVGLNQGASITNCYVTGNLSSNRGVSSGLAGGLVGWNSGGTILRSHSSANVSGIGGVTVGGLIGKNDGSGTGGGLNEGIVAQSYATGSVSSGDGNLVGGLIGDDAGGVLSNVYSTGAVTGTSGAFVGGLMGKNETDLHSTIQDSYSLGAVTGGDGAVLGGLIAQDASDAVNQDDYWDMDTSGINNPSQGAGNIPNDPGIVVLTDTQLKSGLPSGFDPTVWGENSNVNNGYPYLLSNPPPK